MLRELDDEMRFHLEMRVAELRAGGMSEGDARAEAMRRFGDAEELRKYCAEVETRRARRVRALAWLGAWGQDLRFAIRQWRKAPVFTAIAVLTLALGIGANSAIFTVVHRLLLAPLSYPDGNRIVMLGMAAADGNMLFPADGTVMQAWQMRAHTLDAFAAARSGTLHLSEEPADTAPGAMITPGFLRMLEMQPALGRAFTVEETRSGGPHVAMISYEFWQRRYAGRSDIIGSVLEVNGTPRTIVGVTPPGAAVPMSQRAAPMVWVPASLDSMEGGFDAFARLRPQATPEIASRELQAIVATLPNASQYRRFRARAMRAQDFLDVHEVRTIEVLFVAVGVLLLIACVNVANLLLARAWTRRREFAIRAALGAGRGRLARQVLTESVLLALAGGTLGLVIAWQGLHIIIALRPPSLGNLAGIHVEPVVLLWSAVVSVATGILFGSAPALLSGTRFGARVGGDALRMESRTGSGSVAARRIRAGLVIAEVALSLVLMVSAGLLVRSFVALQQMHLGFDPYGLMSLGAIVRGRMDGERLAALRREVVKRVRALPGVTGAAVGSLPGEGWSIAGDIEVEGDGALHPTGIREFTATFVTADYFRVARIALLEGRPFDSTGTTPAPDEVIINHSLARRLWPTGHAVGSRIRANKNAPWATVIGVVNDIRMPGVRTDGGELQVYSLPPAGIPSTALLIRSALPAAAVLPAIRRAIATVNSSLVPGSATTGDEYLRNSLARHASRWRSSVPSRSSRSSSQRSGSTVSSRTP